MSPAVVASSTSPDVHHLAPWMRTLHRLEGLHRTDLRNQQIRSAFSCGSTSPSPAPSPSPSQRRTKTSQPCRLVRTHSTGIQWTPSSSPSPSSQPAKTSSPAAGAGTRHSRETSSSPSPASKRIALSTSPSSGTRRRLAPLPCSKRDPMARLPISIVSNIVSYLDPVDVVRQQRVSKRWRMTLASEHVYTVALLAHFGGTEEAKFVKRRHTEEGESYPECSVGGYRRCLKSLMCHKREKEEE